MPSRTTWRPPTKTWRTSDFAHEKTTCVRGSKSGAAWARPRSMRSMSATLPGSSEPSRSAAPRAAAPSIVAMRSACIVVTAVASSVAARWSVAAEAQRHPHVEVVAGDRPVRPERHPDAGAKHVGHTGDPARELEVRHRVVGDARPRPGEDLDLLVVEPDAVREHRPRVEQPERVEMADDRATVSLRNRRLLRARLRRVDGEEAAALGGEALGGDQILGPDGIGAVRKAAGQHVVGAGIRIEEAFRGRGDGRRARCRRRRSRRRTCRRSRSAPRAPARRQRPRRGARRSPSSSSRRRAGVRRGRASRRDGPSPP